MLIEHGEQTITIGIDLQKAHFVTADTLPTDKIQAILTTIPMNLNAITYNEHPC